MLNDDELNTFMTKFHFVAFFYDCFFSVLFRNRGRGGSSFCYAVLRKGGRGVVYGQKLCYEI